MGVKLKLKFFYLLFNQQSIYVCSMAPPMAACVHCKDSCYEFPHFRRNEVSLIRCLILSKMSSNECSENINNWSRKWTEKRWGSLSMKPWKFIITAFVLKFYLWNPCGVTFMSRKQINACVMNSSSHRWKVVSYWYCGRLITMQCSPRGGVFGWLYGDILWIVINHRFHESSSSLKHCSYDQNASASLYWHCHILIHMFLSSFRAVLVQSKKS